MSTLPTTRKARKAATRKALKQSVLECFSEQGYAETSIGAITQRAGVAHGTFYVHFPSKDAALDELLEDFNDGLVERLMPVFAELSPLRHLVERTARVFLAYWEEKRVFIECYVQRATGGLNLVALRDGFSPQLVEALVQWTETISDGVGKPMPSPQLVTQAMLGLWLRVGLQYLFNADVDEEEAVEVLVRMTWGAACGVLPELASGNP